jgi:hypothetical protein
MNTIQEHILSYFDDVDYDNLYNSKEKLKFEINELNKQYKLTIESAKKMVDGGYFLIDYNDVKEFLKSINNNDKIDSINNQEIWDEYKNLISFNIEYILNYKV